MAKPWIIYTRVSTDEQANEGASLGAQRESCEAMLKVSGTTAVEVIEDAGYSGKSLKRPGVKRLLAMLDRGELAGVCVYRLDRLTRSPRDLWDLVDRFERTDTAIRSVSEMLDTKTAMGRFVIGLIVQIAQWERETIGERAKMGMRSRLAAGGYVGGTVPAGCLVVGEPGNRRLVPDPRWQAIAAGAWAVIAKGGTLSDAVRWLNDQQFPIPKMKGRPPVAWNTNSLHYWINNAKMVGLLVDRETFDAAQRSLAARWSPKRPGVRRAATDRIWPFRGLIRCGHCGQAIVGTAAAGRGGTLYHYLRCTARMKSSNACAGCDLPAAAYERSLLEGIVAAVRKRTDLLQQMAEREAQATAGAAANEERRKTLTMDRDRAKARVDRLLDLVAGGGLAADAAKGRIAAEQTTVMDLDHRLAQLAGEMAAVGLSRANAEAVVDEIRRGVERLLDATPEVQAQGLALLIRVVRLTKDRAEVELFLPAATARAGEEGRQRFLPDDRMAEHVGRGKNRALAVAVGFKHSRQGTGRKWVVTVAP
jgi:site-specific DNA recombinase